MIDTEDPLATTGGNNPPVEETKTATVSTSPNDQKMSKLAIMLYSIDFESTYHVNTELSKAWPGLFWKRSEKGGG